MALLGDMYSFGLLGAFTLTSLGLDRIYWQERKRGFRFWLGLVTSLLVMIAWGTNIYAKHLATIFGGGVTLLAFGLAVAVKRGFVGVAKQGFVSAEAAEQAASALESAIEVLTVDEALDMRAMYHPATLVSVRSPNLRLFEEAVARARGCGDSAVYVLYVDEVPGLFYPPKIGPTGEARTVLGTAVDYFKRAGLVAIPVWRMAHDAGASIAGAVRRLGVGAVMVGTTQRNAIWHLLRGNVVRSLVRQLPESTRLWIVN